VKKALVAAFSPNCFEAYKQFTGRRLEDGESVDVYAADLERLATLVANKWLKGGFVAGLPGAARAQFRGPRASLTALCCGQSSDSGQVHLGTSRFH